MLDASGQRVENASWLTDQSLHVPRPRPPTLCHQFMLRSWFVGIDSHLESAWSTMIPHQIRVNHQPGPKRLLLISRTSKNRCSFNLGTGNGYAEERCWKARFDWDTLYSEKRSHWGTGTRGIWWFRTSKLWMSSSVQALFRVTFASKEAYMGYKILQGCVQQFRMF